jgi:hypothetical protein
MGSPISDLLASRRDACEDLGVGWYLFGAQAALVHGTARLTADVDVTVDLGEYVPVAYGFFGKQGATPVSRVVDHLHCGDLSRTALAQHDSGGGAFRS